MFDCYNVWIYIYSFSWIELRQKTARLAYVHQRRSSYACLSDVESWFTRIPEKQYFSNDGVWFVCLVTRLCTAVVIYPHQICIIILFFPSALKRLGVAAHLLSRYHRLVFRRVFLFDMREGLTPVLLAHEVMHLPCFGWDGGYPAALPLVTWL